MRATIPSNHTQQIYGSRRRYIEPNVDSSKVDVVEYRVYRDDRRVLPDNLGHAGTVDTDTRIVSIDGADAEDNTASYFDTDNGHYSVFFDMDTGVDYTVEARVFYDDGDTEFATKTIAN